MAMPTSSPGPHNPPPNLLVQDVTASAAPVQLVSTSSKLAD